MSGFTIDPKDAMDTYVAIAGGMRIAWDNQQYYDMATITRKKMDDYLTKKGFLPVENYRLEFLDGFLKSLPTIVPKKYTAEDGTLRPLVNVPIPGFLLSLGISAILSTMPDRARNIADTALVNQTKDNHKEQMKNPSAWATKIVDVPDYVPGCVHAIIDRNAENLLKAVDQGCVEGEMYYKQHPDKKPAQDENPTSSVTTDQSTIQQVLNQPYGTETLQQMNLPDPQTDFSTWKTEEILAKFNIDITKDDDGEYYIGARGEEIEDDQQYKANFSKAIAELDIRIKDNRNILDDIVKPKPLVQTQPVNNTNAANQKSSKRLPLFGFLSYCTGQQQVTDPAQQQPPDKQSKSNNITRNNLR